MEPTNQPIEAELVTPEAQFGLEDGQDLGNGEKVVYDRDQSGRVTGWHKEAA